MTLATTSKLSRMAVLLVEDDDDHAELIRMAFAENQADDSLRRFSSGEDLLTFLRGGGMNAAKSRPSLLLLDINLPGMNGHEVLAELRADPALADVPVVFLTTSQDRGDRRMAYTANANAYLVKPASTRQLSAMIGSVLDFWCNWNQLPEPVVAGSSTPPKS